MDLRVSSHVSYVDTNRHLFSLAESDINVGWQPIHLFWVVLAPQWKWDWLTDNLVIILYSSRKKTHSQLVWPVLSIIIKWFPQSWMTTWGDNGHIFVPTSAHIQTSLNARIFFCIQTARVIQSTIHKSMQISPGTDKGRALTKALPRVYCKRFKYKKHGQYKRPAPLHRTGLCVFEFTLLTPCFWLLSLFGVLAFHKRQSSSEKSAICLKLLHW